MARLAQSKKHGGSTGSVQQKTRKNEKKRETTRENEKKRENTKEKRKKQKAAMAKFITNLIEDGPLAGTAGKKTRKNEKKRKHTRKNETKREKTKIGLIQF